MRTAIIILAAGNSSRLGKPKQLLHFNGKTLLDIVTDEALKTEFWPVVVVLGAYLNEIKQIHNNPKVIYTVNENWKTGMSSSIGVGLTVLLNESPDIDSVIITVADQVYITSEIFEALNNRYQSENKNIVTSTYSQTTGTPVLFNKKYFSKLLNLSGSIGAKDLIKNNINDTASIAFELGSIDIDTETDYNNLINNK
ncbi:nucleotidyltransferase family protein [Pedobacter mendelii]|uniref:MobA-like NTP transferase domain-containing protein n=1 Tax=Pedobacter mendelii TaxID=1908240 RepID=A0ABQ2BJ15_9SPHI|nr:nucleotidyltransferase family protein [Pedobacter mendelii]GGI25402.1 hypothetical protein GCM10008119_17480 [Pedobacter mendelii]